MVGLSLMLLLGAAAPQGGPALNPQAQEAFKAWFTRGESLYSEGDYGAAIYAFQQAEKLRATPEVAFDLAKCHEKIGDTAFSTFYYRLYLRRAPTAGDALEVAEILGDVLAKAEANGRGLLEISSGEQGSVTVDGISYPEFPVAVFLAPGDYEITATFATGLQKRTASILNGRVTSVQLDRVPPPLIAYGNEPVNSSWASPADTASSNQVSTKGPTSPKPILHNVSYALIGAGVGAIVVGGLFGAMANGDRTRLSSDKANLTVSEGSQIARSAAGKASTANALFVVGGLTAVAGGVLFTFTLPEPGKTTEGGASP